MSQPELLIHTVKALEKSGHEYMLTGSLVSSILGEPRATHDIDVIVAIKTEGIEAFLGEFPKGDFYYDIDAAKQAIRDGGMLNILSASGDKVDIWTLTDSEFDKSRFSRKQTVELFGQRPYIPSPEDTILMKLLWSKQCGGSEKQLFDAARVYDLQQETLDDEYFESWLQKLDLTEQFIAMQRFLRM